MNSPEMLQKELKAAYREIETLKNQLEVKEKGLANYRSQVNELKKNNTELRLENKTHKLKISKQEDQLNKYKAQLGQAVSAGSHSSGAQNRESEVREGAGAAASGGGERRRRGFDENVFAQIQIAMHMSELETRQQERQMLMMAMHGGAGADQA